MVKMVLFRTADDLSITDRKWKILTSVEFEPYSLFCHLVESPCKQTKLNILYLLHHRHRCVFLCKHGISELWTVLPGYAYFSNLLWCQGKDKIFFLVVSLCGACSWKHKGWLSVTKCCLQTTKIVEQLNCPALCWEVFLIFCPPLFYSWGYNKYLETPLSIRQHTA